MAGALDVAWLTSVDDVRGIETEWRALADRAQGITPFQYPQWILPWYDVWAADRVHVLIVRNDRGALRAVVPCVIQENRVELAGSGVGDYLTPILLDDSEALVAAIDNALSRVGLRIQFNDVPREAPWAAATHDMGRWQIRPSSACPVTSLPESPAAWQRALPSGLRRNLRRYRDRLQDDVDARFETIEHDEGPVPAAINALISLHTKRWRARGLPGVLDDERVRRFHMAAGPALMRSGVLRLHVLRGRSDVIGVQYVLVRGPRAYSYLAGFDPEWDSYSPGTLLMAHAIEHAITGGCTEFDFLRGREPYKYQWGAADRCSLSFSSDVIS